MSRALQNQTRQKPHAAQTIYPPPPYALKRVPGAQRLVSTHLVVNCLLLVKRLCVCVRDPASGFGLEM
jgi:hypothetical protein